MDYVRQQSQQLVNECVNVTCVCKSHSKHFPLELTFTPFTAIRKLAHTYIQTTPTTYRSDRSASVNKHSQISHWGRWRRSWWWSQTLPSPSLWSHMEAWSPLGQKWGERKWWRGGETPSSVIFHKLCLLLFTSQWVSIALMELELDLLHISRHILEEQGLWNPCHISLNQ